MLKPKLQLLSHRKRGPKTGKRLHALRLEQQNPSPEAVSERGVESPLDRPTTRPSPNNEVNESLSLSLTAGSSLFNSNLSQNEAPMTSNSILREYHHASPFMTNNFQDLAPNLDYDIAASTVFNTNSTSGIITSNEHQIQLYSGCYDNGPLPKEKLVDAVTLFLDRSYVAYPVVQPHDIMSRLERDEYLSNWEFHCLLLSIAVLNEAYKVRQSPQHDQSTMNFLLNSVEILRADSTHPHFSESPSLDAVIVSLFLFIAYNVSSRHNRAFCYLTEAIGLFDLIPELSDPVEAIRQQRLECVLYITESATVSIYGSGRKRLISRQPSALPSSAESLLWDHLYLDIDDIVQMGSLDRQAVDLLLLMTHLHLAKDVSEVAKITVDDKLLHSVSRAFNSSATSQNPRCATQTADVAITRQWKLAELWWNDISRRSVLASPEGAINGTLEMIAMTTLTWSKTLQPGYLRIVGLGKLVALTDLVLNISARLGSMKSCTHLIRNLIQTVSETDYEKYFAPQLSITEICIGDIPRPLIDMNSSGQIDYTNEESLV
ncbi:hypothetical protein F5884DRAFT_756078 [Xylogone sp. PMI_703]|nr:hypothetical protein F5884DRAFT_756078 [Xylogone sp. PMI_703]